MRSGAALRGRGWDWSVQAPPFPPPAARLLPSPKYSLHPAPPRALRSLPRRRSLVYFILIFVFFNYFVTNVFFAAMLDWWAASLRSPRCIAGPPVLGQERG
jgi:hypothetical protein